MTKNSEIQQSISASCMSITNKSPFFATLMFFAKFIPSESCPTAATDGKNIYYNPKFLASLPQKQKDGLILHEVLHAALLHVIRRKERDPLLWNIAADIVVNGLILKDGLFELPPGGIRVEEWEDKSVEEVYQLLIQDGRCWLLSHQDILINPLEENESTLRGYWNDALQQATVIGKSKPHSQLPSGIDRQLQELSQSQLDWRSYLWRYLVQTPNDFQGFDRRFIYSNLYIDQLEGESVQVFVAVDTSGSVNDEQMQLFLSEVKGILGAYPHLKCTLYYADSNIYGPYSLNKNDSIPPPKGGGGTSFIPFFKQVDQQINNIDHQGQGVCVYLTDGYGDFPEEIPALPVLWIITPGGLNSDEIPFGEAVRLY